MWGYQWLCMTVGLFKKGLYVYMYICVPLCIYVSRYVCMCVHVPGFVYMCGCNRKCIYVNASCTLLLCM